MTQPALARQVGDDRIYTHPGTGRDDYPSITTVIGVIEKHLTRWSAKCAAEYAVLEHDKWIRLDPHDAVALIAAESNRRRDIAGERGDRIHNYLEAKAHGKIYPGLLPEDAPWKQSADAFWEQWAPDITHPELTVFNDTYGYAGTTDGICDSFAHLGRTVLDYKSGKGMYDHTMLQLEAAANAEYGINDDGELVTIGDIDTLAGIHITPDGAVVRTFQRGTFDVFLAALRIWRWNQESRHMSQLVTPPKRLVVPDVDALERITARAKALIDAGHGAALSAAWPDGLLTPRQAAEAGHTPTGAERDRMAEALRVAEAAYLAPQADVDRAIEQLQALPPDLLAAVEAESRRITPPIPNLRTGRATSAQVTELWRLLDAACNEAAERYSHLAQHVSQSGLDHDVVLAFATTRNTTLPKLMELEAERAVALCSAVADTYVTVIDGQLTVTLDDPDEIIDRLGGRKQLNAAAKTIAERHNLTKHRSADAALADPAMLALLAVAS